MTHPPPGPSSPTPPPGPKRTPRPAPEPPKPSTFRDPDRLLHAREVAAIFDVHRATVTRWAKAGLIGSILTPGGHRRFRESEVRAILAGAG